MSTYTTIATRTQSASDTRYRKTGQLIPMKYGRPYAIQEEKKIELTGDIVLEIEDGRVSGGKGAYQLIAGDA